MTTVNLGDLMDDYTTCRHDPFVEDFIWSIPVCQIGSEICCIQRPAEVAGRDSSRTVLYSSQEIKRNRQGLRKKELSSSEVLVLF